MKADDQNVAELDEKMIPDASPGQANKSGVRKVNNVPIYLLVAIISAFALVMLLVASDKAEKQNAPAEVATKTAGNTNNLAKEIAGTTETGIVAAAETADTKSNQNAPSLEQASSGNNAITVVRPANADLPPTPPGVLLPSSSGGTLNPTVSARKDDLERLQNTKLQMFEEAIKSKPNVQGFKQAGGSSGAVKLTGGKGDIVAELAAVRAQINSGSAPQDPNAVYQAKLEQLKATIGAGSGGGASLFNSAKAATNDQYAKFDKSTTADRWHSDSEMQAPNTPYELRAGFVMPGLLISGINSDLPVMIMAQVSQNVFDTATGKYLLIPQGSRLVGSYSNEVSYGQSRVLVAWQRIIFPDGKALDIGGMPGADSAGYAGYSDKVNNHFWKVFSSAFLMSGIVAGVSLSQNQDSGGTATSTRQRANDAMSEALGQQLGQAMTQMILKNMNVAPTIEIRPGYRFNVVVNKDLTFKKPYQAFDY